MTLKLRQEQLVNGSILYQEIDNPGAGDCGFYAFAIGLIAVIKQELINGNLRPHQLNLLNSLTTKNTGYQSEDFLNFNLSERSGDDNRLLEKLKSDLRHILHNRYFEEIYHGSVIVEGLSDPIRKSAIYMQFMEIFYYFHHGRPFDWELNLLASSPAIRQCAYSLARYFRPIRDSKRLEIEVQDYFMRDLFGDTHFSRNMVDWNQPVSDLDNSPLDPNDIKIITDFKQFKMLAEDYYANSHSDRLLAPDFCYETQAKQSARKMKELKQKTSHQRVKILLGDVALNQDELEADTLYFQIVNAETCQVIVYSKHLDQGHELYFLKAENLLTYLRRSCPEFGVEGFNEIILTAEHLDLFNKISALANDIFDEALIQKVIYQDFIELYVQATARQSENLENNENPPREIGEIEALLRSRWVNPLSYEEKENLRSNKSLELASQVQTSSKIANAMSLLKQDRKWLATHQDLNYLAELFEVHLENLQNGRHNVNSQGVNAHGRPTITINNISNFHWTTRLQIGYLAGKDSDKYANWSYKNVVLTKEEIKSLLLSYTNGFVALFGRTHRNKAEALIARCDDQESSVADIMRDFRKYMYAQEYNPRSSFLKRFEYLDSRFRNFENDLFNKRDIERIFSSYVYTGYNRHHLDEARKIVRDCKNSAIDIADICNDMQAYVRRTQFNQDSAFMECFRQVRQLERYAEEHNAFAPQFAF